MANTYVAIATTTVGSGGASNIEFSSIPGTYTDLCVLLSTRQNNTDGFTAPKFIRFNSDSGSNYTVRALQSNQANSVTSNTNAYNVTSASYIGESPGASLTASTFDNTAIYIQNYASSNQKSYSVDAVSEDNSNTNFKFSLSSHANLWTGTSAITTITIYAGNIGTNNFVQYSTATLYGIKNTV